MIYNNVCDMIGNTPIIKINGLKYSNCADIYVKLEKYNPSGSLKDRAALRMIEDGEKNGILKHGMTIVEASSGNTGISIAMIAKSKGYKTIIIMPENMNRERQLLIKSYGAELILTPKELKIKGSIDELSNYADTTNFFIPNQFSNPSNVLAHYDTTAEEILDDLDDLDYLIAGVGSGSSLSGISKKLKSKIKNIKCIAVEPSHCPVLSGGIAGVHKIVGIGTGFIPNLYDSSLIDEVYSVTDTDAFEVARAFTEKEGISIGISSGACLAVAINISKKIGSSKKILILAADG